MVMAGVQGIGRVGGLVLLALGLAPHGATAQDRPQASAATPERRLSIEAAAGPQLSYVGNTISAAFGFAPTRGLTLLVSAERSYIRDEIEQLEDGYAFERGGTEIFVSAEVRYAFLAARRASPYLVGGTGRGLSRPTVNEFFPDPNERNIHVIYYGGGVRMSLGPRIDAFADARVIMEVEAVSDYFGVRLPVRGGITWRF